MIFTVDQQIAEMRRHWPQLEVVRREGARVAWSGPVAPLLQTYQIEIAYRVPLVVERLNIRMLQPRARVLWPALRPRKGDPEGQLPHVYYLGEAPTDVALCLIDPDACEWSPFDSLAETTVPWTIEWLAAYEGWRATGVWAAPGRHLEPKDREIAL